MQKILAGLEWKNGFVYLDDVLVPPKKKDHLKHQRELLER